MLNVKKMVNKKMLAVILLVALGLGSFFCLSKVAKNPETYKVMYNYLEEKETKVLAMSATVGATSIAIASVPGDATTPLSNKIADISAYLIIILGVIILEKILLTALGEFSCCILIPLTCLLWIIVAFCKKEYWKKFAIKGTAVSLIMLFLIPLSVGISVKIEKEYNAMSKITKVTETAQSINAEIKTEEQKQGGWWSAVVEKAKKTWEKVKDKASEWVDKGTAMLNDLTDAIAVLLITSCVIPLLVLGGFLCLIKYIFGIKVSVSSMQKKVNGAILPQKEDDLVTVEDE